MKPEDLYANYIKSGLSFSKEAITNYCLSLYTKPFVILSGISGTGKTKIAQLFQPYEEEKRNDKYSLKKSIADVGTQYITLTLTKGIIHGDGRGNFRKEDLEVLLTTEEYEDYQQERQMLLQKGVADNFKQQYSITLIDSQNKEYMMKFYIQRASSPLVRARFKSKRGDSNQYNLQPYLKQNYVVGDVIQLVKIGEKRFSIVKSVDQEVIQYEQNTKVKTYDDNICLIPVKSDWLDSSAIVGYYNIIEKKYHIGPFLKHLLYAIENPDVPFFVILDEMNLSKIEYYLSDVLSVLETRLPGNAEDDIILKEKIILHTGTSDDYLDTDDEYFDSIPSKVDVPVNFFITGTINIDETTYTPSPKVLDRANVIEFNEVDLNKYFYNTTIENSNNKYVLCKVPNFTKPTLPLQKVSVSMPKIIKKELISINKILKQYNLHFGYRVASEISLYISHALEYVAANEQSNENEDILYKALDYQISQKILPKISGTQARIEKAIVELFNLFTNEAVNIENIDPSQLANYDPEISRYPLSVKKIINIHTKLTAYGFASSME